MNFHLAGATRKSARVEPVVCFPASICGNHNDAAVGSTASAVKGRPVTVAMRWTTAQSWWIASELCRRNSALHIRQRQDDHGNQQLLVEPDSGQRELIVSRSVSFDPVRGIQAGSGGMNWAEVFAEDDPHAAVKRLQADLGWELPTTSPMTRRSIAYRTAARLLAVTVNDRKRPEVVSWNSMLGMTPYDSSWLSLFGGLKPLLHPYGYSAPQDPPLWVLFRSTPHGILVLSESGQAFRRDGVPPVDLLARYRERGDMDDVIAGLLPPRSTESD